MPKSYCSHELLHYPSTTPLELADGEGFEPKKAILQTQYIHFSRLFKRTLPLLVYYSRVLVTDTFTDS